MCTKTLCGRESTFLLPHRQKHFGAAREVHKVKTWPQKPLGISISASNITKPKSKRVKYTCRHLNNQRWQEAIGTWENNRVQTKFLGSHFSMNQYMAPNVGTVLNKKEIKRLIFENVIIPGLAYHHCRTTKLY